MNDKRTRKFARYIRRTYKNKLMVLVLLGIGTVGAVITDDGTFLVFALILFGPLFFAKDNYIQ